MTSIDTDGFFRSILDACKRAGWRIERTGRRHYRLLAPDRRVRPIYTSSTPSDHRALLNLRADLRRAGLEVP